MSVRIFAALVLSALSFGLQAEALNELRFRPSR